MYRKKRGNETLRINQFKGLNTADSPKNIKDEELSDMMNLRLGKDGTLHSRKGWYKRCSNIDGTSRIMGVHKTHWDDVGDALYVMGNNILYKINESDWTSTGIKAILGVSGLVKFNRYKNKLLLLVPGKPLLWIDSSDAVNLVEYPRPKAAIGAALYISTSAGGSLEENTYYQYTVSYTLGADYKDGETIGALPAESWTNVVDPKNPPSTIIYFPSTYPYQKTTTTNKTLTATDQPFSGTLNGFDVTIVNLFRREAQYVADGFTGLTPWELIDSAFITKVYDGSNWVYQFDTNTMSGEDADGEAVGVITDVTGTYNATTDEAILYIDFTDNGTVDSDVAYSPRDVYSEPQLSSKYMTRLQNRILIANITGTSQESDKKKVCFSYRGHTPLGNDEYQITEIPGFMFPDPMLIFPPFNFFYCDKDDTEDEITGMSIFQDSVIIFTQHRIYLWREGLVEPIKLADTVGCVANDSIKEFEGKLIWLDKNGVYQWDGSKVKNITQDKVQTYIDSIKASRVFLSTAEIHDRRYFLAAPFDNRITNRIVLVYDFDLEEWYPYRYHYYDDVSLYYYLCIDCLFNYHSGSTEELLAGTRYGSEWCSVAQLECPADEDTWGCYIPVSLRTKQFDLKAPDIEKELRNAYVQADNVGASGLSLDVYVDQTDSADDSVDLLLPEFGFIINQSVVNTDYIQSVSGATMAVSLEQGLNGSAFQLGLSADVLGSPLQIKSMGLDWRPKRKAARTIGG